MSIKKQMIFWSLVLLSVSALLTSVYYSGAMAEETELINYTTNDGREFEITWHKSYDERVKNCGVYELWGEKCKRDRNGSKNCKPHYHGLKPYGACITYYREGGPADMYAPAGREDKLKHEFEHLENAGYHPDWHSEEITQCHKDDHTKDSEGCYLQLRKLTRKAKIIRKADVNLSDWAQ